MASFSCKVVSANPAGPGMVSLTIEQRNLAADPAPVRTFSITVERAATNAQVRAAALANIAADEAAKAAAAAEQADALGRFAASIGVAFNVNTGA